MVIIGGGEVVNAAAKHDCQKLIAVAARGVLSITIIFSSYYLCSLMFSKVCVGLAQPLVYLTLDFFLARCVGGGFKAFEFALQPALI